MSHLSEAFNGRIFRIYSGTICLTILLANVSKISLKSLLTEFWLFTDDNGPALRFVVPGIIDAAES